MTARTEPPGEEILILVPRGRDAALSRDLLRGEGLATHTCADLAEFCERMPQAGAGFLTEEALAPHLDLLARALRAQPPWSDFPFVIFRDPAPARGVRLLDVLDMLGNVTLLERPVQKINFATAMFAALRARRRQYQIRDLLRDLEENVRRRDEFLAMLGHELRNPLGAMTAALEVQRRRVPGSFSAELAIVERQTHNLARLVDDLLDVSRVTSGKITLEYATVDVGDLARRCAQSHEVSARAREIEISVSAERDVLVRGDAVRLEEVITNLLTNAIKYTPPGGRIVIEARREGGRALLVVRDNGAGIANEMLPLVFNLFTQAPDTLDRAQGGMGIGLTLVRSLVAMHGGTVEAVSGGTGLGSEFRVLLPLLVEPVRAADARFEDRPGGAEGRRIVLVEDNEDLRHSIRQLLEMDGYRVTSVSNGVEGLETIRTLKPDVALIDIGLPGIDGYDVVRRVRGELGDEVRLVAMTGYGQTRDRERAWEAGFDAHLTKPITGLALRRVLAGSASSSSPTPFSREARSRKSPIR